MKERVEIKLINGGGDDKYEAQEIQSRKWEGKRGITKRLINAGSRSCHETMGRKKGKNTEGQ